MANYSDFKSAALIVDGAVVTADVADSAVTTAKINDNAVTVAKTSFGSSTESLNLPKGTTAQRPGTPSEGTSRYNTDTGSLEFYNGTSWVSTNLIPSISSVTGTIYAGAVSSLVLTVENYTDTVTVRFTKSGSTLSDTLASVTAGSITLSVPSAVYGQSAGDSIVISILNSDGTPSSNSDTKTVVGLPTGGTISTVGSYRYHTITSSGNFVVPTNFTATADYLLVAGGGGGGAYNNGAGGGAGGAIDSTVSLSAQTYSIVIGAGGSAGQLSGTGKGSSGSNSTAFGQTAVAGGAAGSNGVTAGDSGGSGGGGSYGGSGGSGTAGQGTRGGDGITSNYAGGGGGGATQAGYTGANTSPFGKGGDGINWKSLGTYYAGGGGGGFHYNNGSAAGGAGGGGASGNGQGGSVGAATGTAGTANTGGGGGGGSYSGAISQAGPAGAGGSGVCIIRYTL